MLSTCSLSFQVKMYFCEESTTTSKNVDNDAEYAPTASSEPHFSTKKELDDLTRHVGLTKSVAVLLTSITNGWNLLASHLYIIFVKVRSGTKIQ